MVKLVANRYNTAAFNCFAGDEMHKSHAGWPDLRKKGNEYRFTNMLQAGNGNQRAHHYASDTQQNPQIVGCKRKMSRVISETPLIKLPRLHTTVSQSPAARPEGLMVFKIRMLISTRRAGSQRINSVLIFIVQLKNQAMP